jgi:membrane protease YdiL (CAAX protease family)
MKPLLGVILAVAITTALDAGGLTIYSALPLMPLLFGFWSWEKFSRQQIGFRWGTWRDHGVAVLYPMVVLGASTIISGLGGVIDLGGADWRLVGLNLAVVTLATIVVAVVTEEGFFRGWLWASLRAAGISANWVLIGTSLAFSLWHVSAVLLTGGFALPLVQVPIYLLNVAVLGAIWGLLREQSGSVFVPSVSHGLWNGLVYTFFGFGLRPGALGIDETIWYGPEVGLLGLGLNLLFFIGLWRRQTRRSP